MLLITSISHEDEDTHYVVSKRRDPITHLRIMSQRTESCTVTLFRDHVYSPGKWNAPIDNISGLKGWDQTIMMHLAIHFVSPTTSACWIFMTFSLVKRECRDCYLVTTQPLSHGLALPITWYSVVSIPRDLLFFNWLLFSAWLMVRYLTQYNVTVI
jgi:hypothetical protein